MVVDERTQWWEVNFAKAMASQLQLDIRAQNMKRSKSNNVPKDEQQTGTYKTMEVSLLVFML